VHLSEAELAAVAHGETTRVSAAAAVHLASCAECAAKVEALRRSDSEVAQLLGQLDHAAPAIRSTNLRLAPREHRRRVGAIAAGLVLAAGVAAAAVPSSPLHKFLVRTVASVRGGSPPARTNEPVAADQRAGIAFIPGGSLAVKFRNAEAGGQVQIVLTDGGQVSAVASGEAGFSVHQSQLDIDSRGKAMSFVLEIPRTLREVRVEVGDRVFFEKRGDVVAGSASLNPNGPYVVDLGAATGASRTPARR
jgi:anti-sigma factor RsiW